MYYILPIDVMGFGVDYVKILKSQHNPSNFSRTIGKFALG